MIRINISQIDTLFVDGGYPIEFLFYYKDKINSKKIRKVLKELSSSFWPLFGDYTEGSIQASQYSEERFLTEIDYSEEFNSACAEMDMWEKYHQINPQEMEGMFHLSILQFNNGTVLIPKMNHLAGDGYSYFYFLAVLAALSKSSYLPLKKYAIQKKTTPEIYRTALKQFHFDRSDVKEPFEHKNCKITIEKISKQSIDQEIRKINRENNTAVSQNDILSSMAAKKTFELQNADIENQFTISMPMDVRRRVKELGEKFFGNGLMFYHMEISTGDLSEIDYNHLALKLRESMPSIDSDSYKKYLNELETRMRLSAQHYLKPYDPEKGCLITNLSRMPVHKLDFGSGYPDFVFLLTVGKNSTAILADRDDYLLRFAN